jgi:3-deoxy-D-manno-octulosonic-acid transferase
VYLLYSLLLTIGLIAASPLFVIEALRNGKYVVGLSQRLSRIPRINSNNLPIIWLHCVSVGELAAARTLVDAIIDRFPSHRLVISTTTITGQNVARQMFSKQAAAIFYFPIDWAWTVRRVLRIVQPATVLIMETELWPRLFHECHHRGIPVLLINGRISARSFRRYKLVRTFMGEVLRNLFLALMQSDQDAERLRELGMPEERIRTIGNLKFDSAAAIVDDNASELLRNRFGFSGPQPLIVAASTHDPEEQIVIEAFKLVRNQCQARLLIVPRHPERFDEVVSLLRHSGLSWSRRSHEPSPVDLGAEVILLDSIGELRAAYALADIAFVGGSIAQRGGHNVLEPAALGICVITGPHTDNFALATSVLLEGDAIIQLPDLSPLEAPAKLASVLTELLSDNAKRREIGQKAQAVCYRNTGATERTVEAIASVLSRSSTSEVPSVSSLPATAFK